MLKAVNRLKKDKEFKKVFSASRPAMEGRLALRGRKNGLANTRFGFVISNKIEKRSTRRNALKRRFRAAAEELLFEVKSGYDIVVVVKADYHYPYQYTDIAKDFKRGLAKLGLLDAKKTVN